MLNSIYFTNKLFFILTSKVKRNKIIFIQNITNSERCVKIWNIMSKYTVVYLSIRLWAAYQHFPQQQAASATAAPLRPAPQRHCSSLNCVSALCEVCTDHHYILERILLSSNGWWYIQSKLWFRDLYVRNGFKPLYLKYKKNFKIFLYLIILIQWVSNLKIPCLPFFISIKKRESLTHRNETINPGLINCFFGEVLEIEPSGTLSLSYIPSFLLFSILR